MIPDEEEQGSATTTTPTTLEAAPAVEEAEEASDEVLGYDMNDEDLANCLGCLRKAGQGLDKPESQASLHTGLTDEFAEKASISTPVAKGPVPGPAAEVMVIDDSPTAKPPPCKGLLVDNRDVSNKRARIEQLK